MLLAIKLDLKLQLLRRFEDDIQEMRQILSMCICIYICIDVCVRILVLMCIHIRIMSLT